MKSAPKSSSASAPPAAASEPGLADELRAIDTTPLERLLDIRKEEARLEEYRARAEQMKDKVQDVVWRRVVGDYTRRVAALEEQARPLKTQVRSEYQKLRTLFDRTRSINDAAEIEKAELEFRHAVGELTQKQLDDKLQKPAAILERCREDLSAIEELKGRFLSAFGSEEELSLPAAPPPPPEPKTTIVKPAAPPEPKTTNVKAAPPPAPDIEADVTVLAKNPLTKPAAPPAPAIEPDATSVVSLDQLNAMSKAAAESAAADQGDDRTFMLPIAGLLINTDGPAPSEYRLAAMNYLGRSDESNVVIARPGVSRKHALIVAGTDGYSIKDLESQNGTFVNGKRITEQPLQDGDQIVIGDSKIIFRTPWPAGSSART